MNQRRRPGIVGRFFRGLVSPLRGARFLLGHPRLWKFAALPIAINVVIVSILLLFGVHFVLPWIEEMMPQGHQWYWALLLGVVQVLAVIVLLFVVAVIFYILSGIICIPFNEALSLRTEEILKGRLLDEPFSFSLLKTDLFMAVANEIRRSLLLVALICGVLVISLVPVVGELFAPPLGLLVTVLFLAYDNLDYPLARRRLRFSEKRRFVFRHFAACLGFGIGAFFFVLIPFVNSLFVPLIVVGGTLLFREIEVWHGEVPNRGPNSSPSGRGKKR
jgi:CysZ protein